MKKFICPKCGKETVGNFKKNGNQIGVYCTFCGRWIKWLSHKEYNELTAKDAPTYWCVSKAVKCKNANHFGDCTLDKCEMDYTIEDFAKEKKEPIKPEDKPKPIELPNVLIINGVKYIREIKRVNNNGNN